MAMFQFIIKSIIYCLLFLFSFPLLFSVIFFTLTIIDYSSSEKIEGTVVSCVSKLTRSTNTSYPDKTYKNYFKQVQIEDGSMIVGNYGYSSESSCKNRIDEKVEVLVNGNKKEIYTFEDFFLPPLFFILICIFIYGFVFMVFRKYKRLSKIKKPT